MKKLIDFVKGLPSFFLQEIWRLPLYRYRPLKALGIRILRIFALTGLEFGNDRCNLRATALTLYSLLAIVPMLAISFAIAKGFNLQDDLVNGLQSVIERQFDIKIDRHAKVKAPGHVSRAGKKVHGMEEPLLYEVPRTNDSSVVSAVFNKMADDAEALPNLADKASAMVAAAATNVVAAISSKEAADKANEPAADESARKAGKKSQAKEASANSGNMSESISMIFNYVTEAVDNTLEKTKAGAMAGVGVLILLWTVIKLLGNVEFSFNDIYGGIPARSFGRKIIDYSAIIVLLPFLLILSTSATVFLEAQASSIMSRFSFLNSLSPSVHFLIGLTPYVLTWLAFIFLYMFVPNCHVNVVPGVVAGIAAGTIFNLILWFYVYFQVGMAKYSAIYGTFAAVPLFIAWLQVSWTVVLCGAELAYAIQTHGFYEPRDLTETTSLNLWFAIYVHTMGEASRALIDGKPPQTAHELAEGRHLPVQMVKKAVQVLTDCGLLIKLKDRGEEPVYLPACAVETLTVGAVLQKIQRHGNNVCPGLEGEKYQQILAALQNPASLIRDL